MFCHNLGGRASGKIAAAVGKTWGCLSNVFCELSHVGEFAADERSSGIVSTIMANSPDRNAIAWMPF